MLKIILSSKSSLKTFTVVFYLSNLIASCRRILPCFRLSILLNYYRSSCSSVLAWSSIPTINIIYYPRFLITYYRFVFCLPNMYFSLAQHNNIFLRPEKSNLISAVPLCARTVIFFCDDLNFYHYSLIDSKILYQSKLPGRPIQAVSLSGHEILCTIF